MNGRKKVLIALFSALALVVAVTFAGCGGERERDVWEIDEDTYLM